MITPDKKPLSFVCALLLFSSLGCTHQYTLTIHAHPEGAYITEVSTRKSMGTTPVQSYYNPGEMAKYKDANGCFLVSGFEARWVSGATTNTGNLRLCPDNAPNYSYNINREPGFPGLDSDVQYATQTQAQQAIQQKNDSASGLLKGLAEGIDSYNQSQDQQLQNQQRHRTNCTSRVGSDGRSIDTNCY